MRAGVGTDNIDKDAATRQGIVVMNTPGGNTLSTAEHTIALMLALSRNIAPAYQSLLEGQVGPQQVHGHAGGRQDAGHRRPGAHRPGRGAAGTALEMKVLGYDPFLSRERAQELGIEPVETVADMLPRVDYLTVHTPLTDETRGLIGPAQIEKLKPGVRLINCGPRRHLRRSGPGRRDSKRASSPAWRSMCSPRSRARTARCSACRAWSARRTWARAPKKPKRRWRSRRSSCSSAYLTTGAIRHAVNVASLDPKTLASLRGYLDVAYRLGMLLAGMEPGGLKACRLLYRGEIAEKETKILTAVFAAGLLQNALDRGSEPRQRRAAAEAARHRAGRGIAERHGLVPLVDDGRSDHRQLRSTGRPARSSARTCRGWWRSTTSGWRRIWTAACSCSGIDDVPGIIGSVGTIFGRHSVNIAQMAVGRDRPGGEAVGVLNLDGEPSAAALAEVRQLPAITSAMVVQLPPAGQLPAWLQH